MEQKHPLQEPVRYALGELPEDQMTFSVIAARYQNKWVFCRHKDRETWELPGGHIEAGETINITIDDIDYSGVTDITGAVYINLDQLGPGKHYMKVKYEGFNGLKPSTWNGIIQIGDDVIIFGKDKDNTIFMQELANLKGTHCHEILCSITNRVERFYVK